MSRLNTKCQNVSLEFRPCPENHSMNIARLSYARILRASRWRFIVSEKRIKLTLLSYRGTGVRFFYQDLRSIRGIFEIRTRPGLPKTGNRVNPVTIVVSFDTRTERYSYADDSIKRPTQSELKSRRIRNRVLAGKYDVYVLFCLADTGSNVGRA